MRTAVVVGLCLLVAVVVCVCGCPPKTSTPAAPPPEADWKRRNVNGFYDPELAAHFYHLAGDSDDNGYMLVYRAGKLQR